MVRTPSALLRLLWAASLLATGACLDWSSTRARHDANPTDDAGLGPDAHVDNDSGADDGADDASVHDDSGADDASVDDGGGADDGGQSADGGPDGAPEHDADSGSPGVCPASACAATQPCRGDATRYTCAGQFADFPIPARNAGDPLTVQRLSVDRSVIHDEVTGLMWPREGFPTGVIEADAYAYCNELMLGGYDDWRLPSLHEFITLFGGESTPDIDTTVFLSWTGGDYHTATADSEHLDAHYAVRTYGSLWAFSSAADLTLSVTCVRTESVLYTGMPSERFITDGTLVHDTRTRLWWERSTPLARSDLSLLDATSYCTGLTTAGRSFRLPRLAELMSFVDYAQPSARRLASPFEGPDGATYLSRTRIIHIPETTFAMCMNSSGNTCGYDTQTERGAVRCVSPD